MKHYDKLLELGCFSRGDIATMLGNDETAGSMLREYQKKGYIERVRRDLYTVISLETKQPVLSRYQIGCRIFKDCILSHHSAFEYYGYANQVFYCLRISKCRGHAGQFEDRDQLYAPLPCAGTRAQSGQSAVAGTEFDCFKLGTDGGFCGKDRGAPEPGCAAGPLRPFQYAALWAVR